MAEFVDHTNEEIVGAFADVLLVDNVLARAAVRDFGNYHELFGALYDVNPDRKRFGEIYQITAHQNNYTIRQTDRWLEIIAAEKKSS